TIAAARTCREERLPCPAIAIDARRREKPVNRLKVIEISRPVDARIGFRAKQIECAFEMSIARRRRKRNGRKLHPAKRKKQLGTRPEIVRSRRLRHRRILVRERAR
ncbi:MAG: hypothetical protein WCL32_02865, partial [Planctomycetota bacterium]